MENRGEKYYEKLNRDIAHKFRRNLRDTYHNQEKGVAFYLTAFAKGYADGNKQAGKISPHKNIHNNFENIVEKLREKYPLITVDNKLLGEPRLAGTRFAVSNVLTALTLHDSFAEVIDEYDNRYSEEQLKDAVRFARDFLDSFYLP